MEPLLALRRHREQTLQVQLAESQRALEEATDRVEAIQAEMSSQAERLAKYQGKGHLDMDRLNLESSYLAVLERKLDDEVALVDRLAQRTAEDREAVLHASREKKALERLRETLLLSFAKEEVRKELKDAEEVATTRHVRRQQEEQGVSHVR